MSLNIEPVKKVSRHRETTPCLLQFANNNRSQGRFNDVTIRSGDISISANRMVLSCYCSYFDQLFQSQNTDQIRGSYIDLHKFDGKSLELIIDFIYTGQICVDSDNVLNILSNADQLEIDEMKQFCFEFLEDCITPDNCIAILVAAKHYKNFTLRDKVYQHISDNYQTITQTPAFAELDNLELFLIVFHLKTQFYISDEVLCRSLLSWTKHDEEKRTESLPRFTEFVNVDELSYNIVKDLLSESLIQQNPDFLKKVITRMEDLKTKILSVGGHCTGTSVKVVYSLQHSVNTVYPDLPIPLSAFRLLILKNFVYCVGGFSNVKAVNKALRMNLNKSNLKWKEVASLQEKRFNHGAAVFNETLVVCGGFDDKKALSSTECYQPGLNGWKQISSLNQVRSGNQSATSGGCLYTMGGWNEKDQFISTVERLDGLNQPWKYVSSMQTSRCWFVVVACDDIIYAIGGGPTALKSVEKYDYKKDEWEYVCEMKIGRKRHSACVLHGKIFVVGGMNQENEPVKEIECYDPSTDRWEIVAEIDDELSYHCLVNV